MKFRVALFLPSLLSSSIFLVRWIEWAKGKEGIRKWQNKWDEGGLNLMFLQENRDFFQMESCFPKGYFPSQKVIMLLSRMVVNFWSRVLQAAVRKKRLGFILHWSSHMREASNGLRSFLYSAGTYSHRDTRQTSILILGRLLCIGSQCHLSAGLGEYLLLMLVWEEKQFRRQQLVWK